MASETFKNALTHTLMDLRSYHYSAFRFFCEMIVQDREVRWVKFSSLMDLEPTEITDLLVSRFTEVGTLLLAVEILRKIGCTRQAQILAVEARGPSFKPDPKGSSPSEEHFVDRCKDQLILYVSDVEPILDELLTKGVIQQESYDKISALPTSEEKVRELLDGHLTAVGSKDIFYDVVFKTPKPERQGPRQSGSDDGHMVTDVMKYKTIKNKELSSGYKMIQKPYPEKSLKMRDRFILTADMDSAEIYPEKLKLIYDGSDPNFFEVFIENPDSHFQLTIRHESGPVWTCAIRKDDYQNTGDIQGMYEEELARARPKLVEKVSRELINQLLDDLLKDRVLNEGEKDSVLQENNTTADRARRLIDMVKNKGREASRKIFTHLQSRDPTLSAQLGLPSGLPV